MIEESNNLNVYDYREWEDFCGYSVTGANRESYYFELLLKSKNSDMLIPAVILSGNIGTNYDKLKEFNEKTKNINCLKRIGIYRGRLDSRIREFVSKNNITLFKKIIISYNGIEKIISVTEGKKFNELTLNGNPGKVATHRREKISIIREILLLLIGQTGANITKIIYKCNLNYEYAMGLLNKMIEDDYISIQENGEGIKYRITQVGIEYLNTLKHI